MKENAWMTAGIWVWGFVPALLGIIIVVAVLSGRWPRLLKRIVDAATALGAVVAASALAWSYFFQTRAQTDQTDKLQELTKQISALSERVQHLTDQHAPSSPPQPTPNAPPPTKQP